MCEKYLERLQVILSPNSRDQILQKIIAKVTWLRLPVGAVTAVPM